jgi:Ni,Fe-hydrogenase III large subunit
MLIYNNAYPLAALLHHPKHLCLTIRGERFTPQRSSLFASVRHMKKGFSRSPVDLQGKNAGSLVCSIVQFTFKYTLMGTV